MWSDWRRILRLLVGRRLVIHLLKLALIVKVRGGELMMLLRSGMPI